MLNENQILLPLQAQQLGRSCSGPRNQNSAPGLHNGRILVHVEIVVRQTVGGEMVQQHVADIQKLCVGEIPVLVGSKLCYRHEKNPPASYFIVNGQCKVIVSQERH